MKLKNTTIRIALPALVLLSAGCIRDRNQREWEYMPDMYRSDAIKAQEAAPPRAAEDTLGRIGVRDAFPETRETPHTGAAEDTAMSDTSRPDTARVDTSKADTAKGGAVKTDTARGDTAKGGAARSDTAQGDTGEAGAAAAVPETVQAYPLGNSLMRLPPEGTVPRDREVYWPEISDSTASFAMVNPLPVTEEVLETGRKYFNIYCTLCHGHRGAGDGPIIPKMPPPPALSSDKVRQWPDGRIHHVIVHGQGNMPSYRRTVDVTTRWAIIHYLRVIQRAENPTAVDLQQFRLESKRHL